MRLIPTISIADSEAWRPDHAGLTDADLLQLYSALIPTLPPAATIVEVGVWCGRSVAFAAALLVQLGRLDSRVWGVDRWAWPHDGRDPECGTVPWPDAVQCLIASASELELELIQLVRARSAEACRMWDDATVDLVVLDADHTRQGTEAAIEDWRPTIRPGGWIAGHDWGPDYPGVAEAVLATWPAGRVERLGTCWAVQLLGPS